MGLKEVEVGLGKKFKQLNNLLSASEVFKQHGEGAGVPLLQEEEEVGKDTQLTDYVAYVEEVGGIVLDDSHGSILCVRYGDLPKLKQGSDKTPFVMPFYGHEAGIRNQPFDTARTGVFVSVCGKGAFVTMPAVTADDLVDQTVMERVQDIVGRNPPRAAIPEAVQGKLTKVGRFSCMLQQQQQRDGEAEDAKITVTVAPLVDHSGVTFTRTVKDGPELKYTVTHAELTRFFADLDLPEEVEEKEGEEGVAVDSVTIYCERENESVWLQFHKDGQPNSPLGVDDLTLDNFTQATDVGNDSEDLRTRLQKNLMTLRQKLVRVNAAFGEHNFQFQADPIGGAAGDVVDGCVRLVITPHTAGAILGDAAHGLQVPIAYFQGESLVGNPSVIIANGSLVVIDTTKNGAETVRLLPVANLDTVFPVRTKVDNFAPDAEKQKLATGLMLLIANLEKGLGETVTDVTVAAADDPFVITINNHDYTVTQAEIQRYADLLTAREENENLPQPMLVCQHQDSPLAGGHPAGDDALLCFTGGIAPNGVTTINVPELVTDFDHEDFTGDEHEAARAERGFALRRIIDGFNQGDEVTGVVRTPGPPNGPNLPHQNFEITVSNNGVPETFIVTCEDMKRYDVWCKAVEEKTAEGPPVLATNQGLVYWDANNERQLCRIANFNYAGDNYLGATNNRAAADVERPLFSALRQLESSNPGKVAVGGVDIAMTLTANAGNFHFLAPPVAGPGVGIQYEVSQVQLQDAKRVGDALVFQCDQGGNLHHMIYQPNDPDHPPMIFAGDLFDGIANEEEKEKLVRLLIKLQHSQGISNVRKLYEYGEIQFTVGTNEYTVALAQLLAVEENEASDESTLQFQCSDAAAAVDMVCFTDNAPVLIGQQWLERQGQNIANNFRPRFDVSGNRIAARDDNAHRPPVSGFVFAMVDVDGKRKIEISITTNGGAINREATNREATNRGAIYRYDPVNLKDHSAGDLLPVTRMSDDVAVQIYNSGLPIRQDHLELLCRSERAMRGVGRPQHFLNPVGVGQDGSLVVQIATVHRNGKVAILNGDNDAWFKISPVALQNINTLRLNADSQHPLSGQCILAEKVVPDREEKVYVIIELDDKGKPGNLYQQGIDDDYQQKLQDAKGFQAAIVAVKTPTSPFSSMPAGSLTSNQGSGGAGVRRQQSNSGHSAGQDAEQMDSGPALLASNDAKFIAILQLYKDETEKTFTHSSNDGSEGCQYTITTKQEDSAIWRTFTTATGGDSGSDEEKKQVVVKIEPKANSSMTFSAPGGDDRRERYFLFVRDAVKHYLPGCNNDTFNLSVDIATCDLKRDDTDSSGVLTRMEIRTMYVEEIGRQWLSGNSDMTVKLKINGTEMEDKKVNVPAPAAVSGP